MRCMQDRQFVSEKTRCDRVHAQPGDSLPSGASGTDSAWGVPVPALNSCAVWPSKSRHNLNALGICARRGQMLCWCRAAGGGRVAGGGRNWRCSAERDGQGWKCAGRDSEPQWRCALSYGGLWPHDPKDSSTSVMQILACVRFRRISRSMGHQKKISPQHVAGSM